MKEIKKRKELSDFHWDVIRLGLTISIFVYSFYATWFINWLYTPYGIGNFIFARTIIGAFVLFAYVIAWNNINNYTIWKYKIIYKNGKYYAKVIRLGFLFIPYEDKVDYEWHSFNYKNMFGGKETSGYSTEITYSTEQQARDAIDKFKLTIREGWNNYFKRNEVEYQIIKY
jgi:hypothetical protein